MPFPRFHDATVPVEAFQVDAFNIDVVFSRPVTLVDPDPNYWHVESAQEERVVSVSQSGPATIRLTFSAEMEGEWVNFDPPAPPAEVIVDDLGQVVPGFEEFPVS